jgi:tetratricopeptide (TPR) repeat protein
VALAATLGILPGPPAPAQPVPNVPPGAASDEAEAQRLFHEGNALRNAGDLEQALARYLASRRLVGALPNTWNAAICLAELGRHDEALELYEELLVRFAHDLGEPDRTEVRRQIARLLPLLGRLDVHANVDAALAIDGRARGSLPSAAPIRVLPGRHHVVVRRAGYQPFEVIVGVRAGERLSVQAVLRPSSAPPPPATAAVALEDGAPSELQRTLGWVATGIGSAALGIGLAAGIAAFEREEASGDECPEGRCSALGVTRNEEAQAAATVSNVGFAVGVSLGALGVVLVVTAD